MSKSRVLLMAIAMFGFLFAVSAQSATTPSKPVNGQITGKGQVQVAKDKQGNIESVSIATPKGKVCHVTLDAKGKELGKTMEGKYVEATGVKTMKGNEHWLTVEKFMEYTPKK